MSVESLQIEAPRCSRAVALHDDSAPSLRRNFVWSLAGNLIYAACQWGFLILLAKAGSPDILGRFVLALAITAPVFMLTNLQLRAIQATDARGEFRFADYLGLRLGTNLLAMGVISLIAFLVANSWEAILVIFFVGLMKAFESLSDVVYGLFQQRERMQVIAQSSILRGVLSLLVLGVCLWLGGNLVICVATLALAWGFTLIAFDLARAKGVVPEEELKPRWDRTQLVRLTWLTLPMGVVMMLISLNTNIPRYFLERQWSEWELGIFAGLAYFMVAGQTAVSALGQTAQPRLAHYFADGDKAAFRRLLLGLVGVGVLGSACVVAVVFFAGAEILGLLYTPEYAVFADLLLIIALATGISAAASFLGYAMTAARYLHAQTPLFVAVLAVTFVACAVLVPAYGVYGAAWAIVLSAICQLGGSAVIVNVALNERQTARSSRQGPIRILHVLGGLNRGGAETWLLHVVRHADPSQFRHDFLVHTTDECAYDTEVIAQGATILSCPGPGRPLTYARTLRRILHQHGPYDVVHSHVHYYSGLVLRVAHRARIPVRIAHSHCDTTAGDARSGFVRRLYLRLMSHWIVQYATHRLAAGQGAAVALFGPHWQADPHCQIVYYGIDLGAFTEDLPSTGDVFGFAKDAFVMGHVGRFDEQKNHRGLIEIAAEVMKREPKAVLLLVGDGPLRPAIQQLAVERGIAERVVFAGLRPDVPQLLRRYVNVFVMPSLFEGLPLAGLEAQAAGLPCILSDTITSELAAAPELIRRLPLTAPPAVWAQAILNARELKRSVFANRAVKAMQQSPFNIPNCMKKLEGVYASATP